MLLNRTKIMGQLVSLRPVTFRLQVKDFWFGVEEMEGAAPNSTGEVEYISMANCAWIEWVWIFYRNIE